MSLRRDFHKDNIQGRYNSKRAYQQRNNYGNNLSGAAYYGPSGNGSGSGSSSPGSGSYGGRYSGASVTLNHSDEIRRFLWKKWEEFDRDWHQQHYQNQQQQYGTPPLTPSPKPAAAPSSPRPLPTGTSGVATQDIAPVGGTNDQPQEPTKDTIEAEVMDAASEDSPPLPAKVEPPPSTLSLSPSPDTTSASSTPSTTTNDVITSSTTLQPLSPLVPGTANSDTSFKHDPRKGSESLPLGRQSESSSTGEFFFTPEAPLSPTDPNPTPLPPPPVPNIEDVALETALGKLNEASSSAE